MVLIIIMLALCQIRKKTKLVIRYPQEIIFHIVVNALKIVLIALYHMRKYDLQELVQYLPLIIPYKEPTKIQIRMCN